MKSDTQAPTPGSRVRGCDGYALGHGSDGYAFGHEKDGYAFGHGNDGFTFGHRNDGYEVTTTFESVGATAIVAAGPTSSFPRTREPGVVDRDSFTR